MQVLNTPARLTAHAPVLLPAASLGGMRHQLRHPRQQVVQPVQHRLSCQRWSTRAAAQCPFKPATETSNSTWAGEHLPFKDQPYRMTLGVQPVPSDQPWFEIDEWYDEEMALKRKLLDSNHSLYFQARPEAEPAAREVLQQLAKWLADHYPDRFTLSAGRLSTAGGEAWDLGTCPEPLLVASLLVQEDLVIVTKAEGEESKYTMAAGSVCFPMRWSLMQKMGADMQRIHEPVPGFEEIRVPVDTFIERMKPGRSSWRANWGLDVKSDLSQPLTEDIIKEAVSGGTPVNSTDGVNEHNAGEKLYLRVERQTLTKMPITQAVLFTIRTYVTPLHQVVANRPEVAKRLAGAMRHISPEFAAYKAMGTSSFRESVVKHLEREASLMV